MVVVDAIVHEVQRCFIWIQVWGVGGLVNSINAFVIQELMTHSRYMRPGAVLHLRNPVPTSIWSASRSEDLTPHKNSQGTSDRYVEVCAAL